MPEANLTNAELAILSLVAESDRYGYEIEQVLEARGMRAWTEVGFSSIYYLLKKLERKGFVASERLAPAGPGKARVVYSLLPPGARALKQGVREALSIPQPAPPAFLLGLANLPALEPAVVRQALAAYCQALDAREQDLLQASGAGEPLPFFVQAMFDYSLALLQAERNWITDFRVQMEDRSGQDRP